MCKYHVHSDHYQAVKNQTQRKAKHPYRTNNDHHEFAPSPICQVQKTQREHQRQQPAGVDHKALVPPAPAVEFVLVRDRVELRLDDFERLWKLFAGNCLCAGPESGGYWALLGSASDCWVKLKVVYLSRPSRGLTGHLNLRF